MIFIECDKCKFRRHVIIDAEEFAEEHEKSNPGHTVTKKVLWD